MTALHETAARPIASHSTLEKLVALAGEPACGRRRMLLHEITDPLFAVPPLHRARLDALLPLVAEELAAAEYARRARLPGKPGVETLYRLLRDGQTQQAIHCFAELTEIGYEAARGVFADPTDELLAMICKAQRRPRDQFITIALLRDRSRAPTREAAEALAALYDAIPLAAAERALRFWRLRMRIAAGESLPGPLAA